MKIRPQKRAKSGGFTLVELLIVILTLGILALMLFPALAKIRQRSTVDVCLENQKQLATAWVMFGSDHGDYMASAGTQNNRTDSLFAWRVDPANMPTFPTVPTNQSPTRVLDNAGFQLGGLYPYTRTADNLLHCPADSRYLIGKSAWCTYAIVDNMHSQVAASFGSDFRLHKVTQIKTPGARMIFTEENDSRSESANGFTVYENQGSWVPYHPSFATGGDAPNPSASPKFSTMAGGGMTGWWDGPAAFHAGGATFNFCDGHAEFHRWRNQNTLAFATSNDSSKAFGPYSYSSVSFFGEPDDLTWVYSRIASPLWP